MERDIIKRLVEWKGSARRKPLIVNGARQVGKTYILREFGRRHYRNVAYLNCDGNASAELIFSGGFDMRRIVRSLSAATREAIVPGETLIIIDEIQECPSALASLKYFCEDAPDYHVAVAGSLLGVSLHGGVSFPVGKVDMLRMYPMTFGEFLRASGEALLAEALSGGDYGVIDALSPRLTDMLRQYYYVGGMPGVVGEYLSRGDLGAVRSMQKQIVFDYRRDFSKHAPGAEVPRINMVWDSIPSQLAKDNKKFVYGALKRGGRAAEFELAIQWLEDAGLVYRVRRASKPELPLKFYEDASAFKLFMLDVGLMGAMADVPAESVLVSTDMMSEYRGAFTELLVLTQLMPSGLPIYYYSSNDSRVEIDFLVQRGSEVWPVEVKAEVNVRSKSLRTFVERHPGLRGVRLSMLPFKDQGWMVNVPLYCVGNFFNSY